MSQSCRLFSMGPTHSLSRVHLAVCESAENKVTFSHFFLPRRNFILPPFQARDGTRRRSLSPWWWYVRCLLLHIVAWTRHGIYCLANIFIGYTQELNEFCPSPVTVTVKYEYRAISCIPWYIAYIHTYIRIIICTKPMAVHTYEWTIQYCSVQYCSSCCYALCTL